MTTQRPRVTCSACGRSFRRNRDGTVWVHGVLGYALGNCWGSRKPPRGHEETSSPVAPRGGA
jgi:hypothetical protein